MSDIEAVRQILARYVRAADRRDGAAMASLFVENGIIEISHNDGGHLVPIGRLEGRDQIAQAVTGMMRPHPERGWSHHATFDHIIEIDGDVAEVDAQFIVYNTAGAVKPSAGWPAGAFGAQGTVTPVEAGYYRPTLRRINYHWRIQRHRIDLDLPMAAPGA
jgi:SnoaL-like domain